MGVVAWSLPDFLTPVGSLSILCDGADHQGVVELMVSADAPPGHYPIVLSGTLSNGAICTKNVQVTVFTIQPVDVDARDPRNAVIRYRIHPNDFVLDSATFSGAGVVQTWNNIAFDLLFLFDQASLISSTNLFALAVREGDAECNHELIVNRKPAHAPPQNTAIEDAVFRVPIQEGGGSTTALVRVTHRLFEQFSYFCYPIDVVPGSKTILVGTSLTSITTYEQTFIPTEISAWNESHSYWSELEISEWTPMIHDQGATLPPQSEHFRSATSSTARFFVPGTSLSGLANIDGILFADIAGPIWGIPDPLVGNTQIDLPIEANADPPFVCP